MYDRELRRMHEKVRLRQYVITVHADEEMDDDGLTIFDVENAILTGKIVERRKDRETNEPKYLVCGQTIDGMNILVVVTKFGLVNNLIIITVYVE